jgi:hypothetical protein
MGKANAQHTARTKVFLLFPSNERKLAKLAKSQWELKGISHTGPYRAFKGRLRELRARSGVGAF